MKRIILIFMILLCFLLFSCGATDVMEQSDLNGDKSNFSMFIKVETTDHWVVVYHKDTKVMYVVSNDAYIQGIFTMLVNADGTPMIYGGY